MGLLSVFRRSAKAEPDSAEDLQRARSRARQRLIGAVVLVGVGIVGFPLIFETHPRPIPIDTPIEFASKDKAAPLAMPPSRAASGGAGTSVARAGRDDLPTEAAAEAGREVAAGGAPASASPVERTAAAKPSDKAGDKATERATEKAAEKPTDKAQDRVATHDKPADKPSDRVADKAADKPADRSVAKPAAKAEAEAARAKALLEGRSAPATTVAAAPAATAVQTAGEGRYVLQVGAYAESDAAREIRQKVEKLGLKTYTQVVDTSAGSRIRVRVGPFASKDEADRAAGRLKSAGLPAALLTL